MSKKIPLRQCVGCGEMKNKKEMMRVLKTAENEIVLDVTGKKNGRGAYLCVSKDCSRFAEQAQYVITSRCSRCATSSIMSATSSHTML